MSTLFPSMLHQGVLGPWSVLIFQSRSLWTSVWYSSPRKDVGSLVILEDLCLRQLGLFPFASHEGNSPNLARDLSSLIISLVMAEMLYFGFHPHSLRARLSSTD